MIMLRHCQFLIRTGLFLVITVTFAASVPAQMTIFNIPSTDTLQKRSFYVEGDFTTKLGPYNQGGFRSYGVRTVYGLDHKTEIGVNAFYTTSIGDPFGEMQFSVKRKLYDNEAHGLAVSAGALAFVPLQRPVGSRSSVMFYGNVSKTIRPLKGARVTSGIYTVVGGGNGFGTRTGAMLGLEQPLFKKFSFIGDWFSGRNRFGYVNAGINYAITKRQFILAGYSFGNSGAGNNAFNVYYGYTY
jgi:hypothetical protein